MNKSLLLVNGKESLFTGSVVNVKGGNIKANAYLAAKLVSEIVSGIDNEAFGHVDSTGEIYCFTENISLSWIGSSCLCSANGRLRMYPSSIFKDGWTWEDIKGQIVIHRPELVVIDSDSINTDEIADTAKENGCCIMLTSCDAYDKADEVFEVSIGDDMQLDVTHTMGGKSLSFKVKANVFEDSDINTTEKAEMTVLSIGQLRRMLNDEQKRAKTIADKNIVDDAIDELMIAQNHFDNVLKIIKGDGMEEPTISDKYTLACSYIHEFWEVVSDEYSATDDAEALSFLAAAQKMISDAEAILERAYLYADGKQRGKCIRVVLNTFGEYFLPDWTSTERRVTGLPMPLEQK